jgi:excinuclease ABC subunit C
MPKFSKIITSLPQNPGVYLFKNKAGQVLYVGKASNLKNRIASYFRKSSLAPDKFSMLDKIASLEYVVTDSEIEALLLEANLIKKYQPKYNTVLKDDKNYQHIKIDYSDDFPKILTARKKKEDKMNYFGPFPSSRIVKQILNLLNSLFHFRECKIKMTEIGVKDKKYKICLRYHLSRCYAPCIGKISKKDYALQILQCKIFLEGKKKKLLKNLENKMKLAAKNHNFEGAAKLRDQIFNLKSIKKYSKSLSCLFDGRQNSENRKNILLKLVEILNLKFPPRRIECFDISNIQGEAACGAMAVFENNLPSKSEYRRFKIKMKNEPNDVAMMEEVLMRRFRHSPGVAKRSSVPKQSNATGRSFVRLDEANASPLRSWPLPDLIVLDGGKGQLGAAQKVLKEYKLKIPTISLSKKKEEIYLPNKLKPKILPRNSTVLFLLQRLRDEAHRFAVSYHRNLRRKTLLT